MNQNQLEKIEKKTKLNWLEKRTIKKLIKHAKKKIDEINKQTKEEIEYRHKLEKELLSMTDVLEITTDQGKSLNKTNIKTISNKELTETLIEAINQMEKLL